MKMSPALELVMRVASSAITRKVLNLNPPPRPTAMKRRSKKRGDSSLQRA